MSAPLLDLATRPPSGPRCLVHAESDRARSGTAVAVLLTDPTGTSRNWPLALAAYRQIWSRYKAHAPVERASDLLAEVAADFATKFEPAVGPDLVVALVTFDGATMAAWALPSALVLVRHGDELGELGPAGFHTVSAAGSLARASEGSDLWHGRIEVEPGTGFCMISREAAARMGLWRLREALGTPAADGILAEIGRGEESMIAGRLSRVASRERGQQTTFLAPVASSGERTRERVLAPAAAGGEAAPRARGPHVLTAGEKANLGAGGESSSFDFAAASVASRPESRAAEVDRAPTRGGSLAETADGAEMEHRGAEGDRAAIGDDSAAEREPAGGEAALASTDTTSGLSAGARPIVLEAGLHAPARAAESQVQAGAAEPRAQAGAAEPPAQASAAEPPAQASADGPAAETVRQDEAAGPAGAELDPSPPSVLLRSRRRSGDPRQTSWLNQLASRGEMGSTARSESHRESGGATRSTEGRTSSVEVLPPFGQRDVLPDAPSDLSSDGLTREPGVPGVPEDGFVLPGRRHRTQDELSGLRSLLSRIDYSGSGAAGHAGSGSLLLRRWLTWAVLGISLVLTLAVLILIGRLLIGRGPEGPEVESLALRPATEQSAPQTPPPPSFTGASWIKSFSDGVSSSPLILGDRLVVGCRDGNLYAIGLSDGEELWRASLGAGMGSSPSSFGSLAAIGTYSGDVVAVDTESGAELWRYRTGGRVVSSPAFHSAGILVIGSHDKHIYGLGAVDGELKWKVPTRGIVWASPIIEGNQAIIGSYDQRLYCLDVLTGSVIWTAETGGSISSTAAVAGDRVVVGADDGRAYAVSLVDGRRLWSASLGSAVNGSVTAAGDLVLVGTDGGALVALAASDGTERYRVPTRGAVKCRPTVAEGRVWFTSYDGGLRVTDLASGEELWSYQAEGTLFSSPAVLGRTAFFGSLAGKIYAATWAQES